MIKILIVDDSETETAILKQIFGSEPDIEVIGCAKNGKEAVQLTKDLKPDLITMDIHMPVMDGLEATRIIMTQCPTPIVVISSNLQNQELRATYKALEAGALSVLEKPVNIASPQFEPARVRAINMIRSMAEIKVIKKRFSTENVSATSSSTPNNRSYELLAIGTSIGGPQALKLILSNLPKDFPVPIVIVQHMTNGFISGFSKWLDKHVELHVKDAEDQEVLKAGTVYFAPDNYHLTVQRSKQHLIAALVNSDPVSGFCPSATVLFESVAKTCKKQGIGILLTGMGNDGAQGLLELKQAHGHTLIQDPESAVVFGMAGVAQSLGAVDKVVELSQMAKYLIHITGMVKSIVETS